MGEHVSRAFCEDVGCKVREKLNTTESQSEYQTLRGVCRYKCRAYDFYQWLNDNNYELVKED